MLRRVSLTIVLLLLCLSGVFAQAKQPEIKTDQKVVPALFTSLGNNTYQITVKMKIYDGMKKEMSYFDYEAGNYEPPPLVVFCKETDGVIDVIISEYYLKLVINPLYDFGIILKEVIDEIEDECQCTLKFPEYRPPTKKNKKHE